MSDQVISCYHVTNLIVKHKEKILELVQDKTLAEYETKLGALIAKAEVLQNILRSGREAVEKEKKLLKALTGAQIVPKALRGNRTVWKTVRTLWECVKSGSLVIESVNSDWASAQTSFLVRSGVRSNFTDIPVENAAIAKCGKTFCLLATAAEATERLITSLRVRKDEKEEYKLVTHKHLGPVVKVDNVAIFLSGTEYTAMSSMHMFRVASVLKALANLSLGLSVTPAWENSSMFMERLILLCESIAEDWENHIGEALKGARNAAVNSLGNDNPLGYDNKEALLSFMTTMRQGHVVRVEQLCQRFEFGPRDTCAILNFYKMIPESDVDPVDGFLQTYGAREPNRVDPANLEEFGGMLRKAVYMSSYHSRIFLESADRLHPLSAAMASATPKLHELKAASPALWATMEFAVFAGKEEDFKAKIDPKSKKSSKPLTGRMMSSLRIVKDLIFLGDKMDDDLEALGTIDDLVSTLVGKDQLDGDEALHTFKALVREWEAWEQENGHIDDVAPEVLEKAIFSGVLPSYPVSTDEKSGEVHKSTPRVFYLGAQKLKAMTQRVERLWKALASKQPGVSISKTFKARQQDLENFATLYRIKVPGKKVVFLSFDMEEFSKKFPMELVREAGAIMAEITGIKCLKRIDLFFRSAIVYFKTRGFAGSFAGVKGGFEGFLNFVWSSVMAIVIEMGLNCIGVQGEILAYSDDGLVAMYVDENITPDELHTKVLALREFFLTMGLVFHLGKTLVSCHTWEYLGEICHKGCFIPLWVKELCSVGKKVDREGLSVVYDYVVTLEGQSRACMKHGAPVEAVYVLMMYYFLNFMRRKFPKATAAQKVYMSIMSPGMGGMRLPGPLELSSLTSVPAFSEVEADLMQYHSERVLDMHKVLKFLNDHARTDEVDAICTGSYFLSNLPDLSGLSAANWLLSKAQIKAEVYGTFNLKAHPIDDERRRLLRTAFTGCTLLDIEAVSQVVLHSPAWSEYSKSLAIVRGRSIKLLLRKPQIMQAILRDLRSVNNAVRLISSVMHTFKFDAGSPDMATERLWTMCSAACFPTISVMAPRTSMRALLAHSRVLPTYCIAANIPILAGMIPSEEETKQYFPKMPPQEAGIDWIGWHDTRGALSKNKRFLDAIARFHSSYPAAAGTLRDICRAFDVEPPRLDMAVTGGAARRKMKSGSSPDSVVYGSNYFIANLSYFAHLPDVVQLAGESRRDMSTIRTFVTAVEIIRAHRNYLYAVPVTVMSTVCIYALSDWHASIIIDRTEDADDRKTNPPKSTPLWMKPKDVSLTIEEIQTAEREADIATRLDSLMSSEDPIVTSGILEALTDYIANSIRSLYQTAGRTRLDTKAITGAWGWSKQIIIEAIRRALMNVIPGDTRTKIEYQARQYMLSQSNTDFDMFEKLMVDVIGMSSRLITTLVHYEILPSDFELVNVALKDIPSWASWASQRVEMNSLFLSADLAATEPIVVVRDRNRSPYEMSPVYRVVFRRILSNSILDLMSKFAECNWMPGKLREKYGLLWSGSFDELIDYMYVVRATIRESPHRTIEKPMNSTTAMIEIHKFWRTVNYILPIALRWRGPPLLENDAYLMSILPTNFDMLKQFILRAHPTMQDILGPDHTQKLREPMLRDLMPRLRFYMRNKRMTYTPPGTITGTRNLMNSFYACFLSPFVRRIKEIHSTHLSLMVDAASGKEVGMASIIEPPENREWYGCESPDAVDLQYDEVLRIGCGNILRRVLEEFQLITVRVAPTTVPFYQEFTNDVVEFAAGSRFTTALNVANPELLPTFGFRADNPDIALCIRLFKTLASACTAFVNLKFSTSGDGNIYSQDDGSFLVIYILKSQVVPENGVEEGLYSTEFCVENFDVIRLSAMVEKTPSIHASLSGSPTPTPPQLGAISLAQTIYQERGEKVYKTNSPFIHIAKSFSRMPSESNCIVPAYISLLLGMSSVPSEEAKKNAYEEILKQIESLSHRPRRELSEIMIDIGSAIAWLQATNVVVPTAQFMVESDKLKRSLRIPIKPLFTRPVLPTTPARTLQASSIDNWMPMHDFQYNLLSILFEEAEGEEETAWEPSQSSPQ